MRNLRSKPKELSGGVWHWDPVEEITKRPGQIHSLSTASAYRSALTTFCRWIQENQLGNLVQVECQDLFQIS